MTNAYIVNSLSNDKELATELQVLLVEPNVKKTRLIRQYLDASNFFITNVDQAGSLANVLPLIRTSNYDILLLSLHQDRKNNLKTIQLAWQTNPSLPILVLNFAEHYLDDLIGLNELDSSWDFLICAGTIFLRIISLFFLAPSCP